MPLGCKPVLEPIVEEIVQGGIKEILFVISQDKTAIRSHFGDRLGEVRFDYVLQAEQKGLADAVMCGREFTGTDPFAVVLGDSVIETDRPQQTPLMRVLSTFADTDASGVIVVQKTPREEVSRYGIVRPRSALGSCFEIDGLVEKPQPKDAPSEYAVAGRYAFGSSIYEWIERTPRGANNEYQLSDSIALMMRDGGKAWCVALGPGEIRRDIGTFASYFEAFRIEMERYRPE